MENRGVKVKKVVEKNSEKLNDRDGITTLGTFKTDRELQEFIRRKRV